MAKGKAVAKSKPRPSVAKAAAKAAVTAVVGAAVEETLGMAMTNENSALSKTSKLADDLPPLPAKEEVSPSGDKHSPKVQSSQIIPPISEQLSAPTASAIKVSEANLSPSPQRSSQIPAASSPPPTSKVQEKQESSPKKPEPAQVATPQKPSSTSPHPEPPSPTQPAEDKKQAVVGGEKDATGSKGATTSEKTGSAAARRSVSANEGVQANTLPTVPSKPPPKRGFSLFPRRKSKTAQRVEKSGFFARLFGKSKKETKSAPTSPVANSLASVGSPLTLKSPVPTNLPPASPSPSSVSGIRSVEKQLPAASAVKEASDTKMPLENEPAQPLQGIKVAAKEGQEPLQESPQHAKTVLSEPTIEKKPEAGADISPVANLKNDPPGSPQAKAQHSSEDLPKDSAKSAQAFEPETSPIKIEAAVKPFDTEEAARPQLKRVDVDDKGKGTFEKDIIFGADNNNAITASDTKDSIDDNANKALPDNSKQSSTVVGNPIAQQSQKPEQVGEMTQNSAKDESPNLNTKGKMTMSIIDPVPISIGHPPEATTLGTEKVGVFRDITEKHPANPASGSQPGEQEKTVVTTPGMNLSPETNSTEQKDEGGFVQPLARRRSVAQKRSSSAVIDSKGNVTYHKPKSTFRQSSSARLSVVPGSAVTTHISQDTIKELLNTEEDHQTELSSTVTGR